MGTEEKLEAETILEQLEEIQWTKELLEQTNLSDEEKAHMLAFDFTLRNMPHIRTKAQFDGYAKLAAEIKKNARLPEKNDPAYQTAFLAFWHSPEGRRFSALNIRLGQWGGFLRPDGWDDQIGGDWDELDDESKARFLNEVYGKPIE
jgi:hypothetical protein